MNESLILIERPEPHITVLTLNRPEKRNALSVALLEQLNAAILAAQDIPDQRILILKGNGSLFSSGLDLGEAADPSLAEGLSEALTKVLTLLHHTSLVTIALIHGMAIAGGAGIAAACDLAFADENAKIGFPEVRRGLVAAQIMSLLIRQLRQRDLLELLLVGELIPAKKALDIGLINGIYPKEKLWSEAIKFAENIIKGAPQAIVNTKKLLDDLYPSSFEDDIWKGIEVHKTVRASGESQEGIRAFLEKREPQW